MSFNFELFINRHAVYNFYEQTFPSFSVKKAVKRLNVPHPIGSTQHSTTLNKVNTTSTVRRNWLMKNNKRNSIYGKITPHL